MADPFQSTLALVAKEMAMARDPWWIIGSAAVVLHGGDPGHIADVDVLVSRRDLEELYTTLPLLNSPDGAKRMFRSELFGLWQEPPVEVEFMAGLEVSTNDRWEPVRPMSRMAVQCGEIALFVPDKAELIAILKAFGRPKDLQRAATLKQD
ncbi:hypothetical protein ACRAQ6_09405 [Erythrobacter sp. HA6-11]